MSVICLYGATVLLITHSYTSQRDFKRSFVTQKVAQTHSKQVYKHALMYIGFSCFKTL